MNQEPITDEAVEKVENAIRIKFPSAVISTALIRWHLETLAAETQKLREEVEGLGKIVTQHGEKLCACQKDRTALQEQNDQQSKQLSGQTNVITALCEAIDPSFTKGPETDKLCGYAKKTRTILESLAMATHSSNKNHLPTVASEALRHLEGNRQFEPRPNGGILGEPPTQYGEL